MSDLQNKANPNNGLIEEIKITNERLDTLTVLMGALCDSSDANVMANKDVLEEKKKNHAAWLLATNKRFYVSFVTVMLTGAVLYLDVLKLNKDSELVRGLVSLIGALKGLL